MLHILDSKPGTDPEPMFKEFQTLNTDLHVSGRLVGGKFVTRDDIILGLPQELAVKYGYLLHTLEGRWDINSTEL